MKNTDQCAVIDFERVTRLPSAETAVRLCVPIAVKIQGRESLVVRLVRKNFGNLILENPAQAKLCHRTQPTNPFVIIRDSFFGLILLAVFIYL